MIKKLKQIILIVLIMITSAPFEYKWVVSADSYYPMGCSANEFEVSSIGDDGSLNKVSCHSNLAEAKKAMKKNADYVVRYSKSYSPTKIVAMNSGLAYTYPGRRNSSIMYLYQNPLEKESSRYKSTYLANHYEMTYVDTCGADIYDIAKSGKGFIQIEMNGFEGFTDLEYTDLVPSKYIDKKIPIWLGGNNYYENEAAFQVVVNQSYYQLEKKGNYIDLVFHYYRAYPNKGKNGNSALEYSLNVDNGKNYLLAGMKENTKYYSSDGINFYSDTLKTKKVATVYNYYQFLSLRSVTDIDASIFDAFMKKTKGTGSVMADQGSVFINRQNKYGCNALIVYAMACLESAYGTSGYATNRYNIFGWSAYDDSPNDASYFSSIDTCVKEQMGRNLNWFMDYSNRRYFGSFVGNKGAGFNVSYASDPYWGIKISAIAYSIDKFANNGDGNLTDHNKYTLGFVKNNFNDVIYDANIEWDPKFYLAATGKDYLYTARYGSHYQKDLVIILEAEAGDRYITPATNPIENNQIVTEDGILKYNWDNSKAYIDKNKVVQLNNIKEPEIVLSQSDIKATVSLRELSIDADKLCINGVGLIKGMDFNDESKIKYQLVFTSFTDANNSVTVDAKTIDSNGYSLNDGKNYKYSGFEANINLKDIGLTNGSYYVELKVINNDKYSQTYLYSADKNYRTMVSETSANTYRIRMNDFYNYRFEIDVLSVPEELSLSKINKPSARPSSLSIDEIDLSDDGKLNIKAHGFMYYVSYANKDNIDFDIFLVSDKNNYLKLDTLISDSDIDYTNELMSKYDLSNITFEGSGDISSLKGNYVIYVVMKNNDEVTYLDVIEASGQGVNLPAKKINKKQYTFVSSEVRKRLELLIK